MTCTTTTNRKGHTLEALVRPLTSHSSISAGASTAAIFAASMNGSLIMLTVNSFVASMFSLVSLGFRGDKEKEMLNNGGLCATFKGQQTRQFQSY
jgi:hypothetical protein